MKTGIVVWWTSLALLGPPHAHVRGFLNRWDFTFLACLMRFPDFSLKVIKSYSFTICWSGTPRDHCRSFKAGLIKFAEQQGECHLDKLPRETSKRKRCSAGRNEWTEAWRQWVWCRGASVSVSNPQVAGTDLAWSLFSQYLSSHKVKLKVGHFGTCIWRSFC